MANCARGLPIESKSGWIPRLPASLPAHNRSLRFTSDVTPADLLMASMATSHIPYMHVASPEIHTKDLCPTNI